LGIDDAPVTGADPFEPDGGVNSHLFKISLNVAV
jgi:hypothetical protein